MHETALSGEYSEGVLTSACSHQGLHIKPVLEGFSCRKRPRFPGCRAWGEGCQPSSEQRPGVMAMTPSEVLL